MREALIAQHGTLRQQARAQKQELESRHRSLVVAIEREQEEAQDRVEKMKQVV